MINIPQNCKVYSFDIFDTTVTRTWAKPQDVFNALEERMVEIDDKWSSLASSRMAAEFDLRKRNNFTKEVTLSEIYLLLQERMGLDDDDIDRVCALELELESESIIKNPEIANLINALRQRGNKIIFTSDIYLPRDFVKSMLTRHEILNNGDNLYISSELGIQKSTGDLFEHILKSEKIRHNELCHIGDNMDSDYKMPSRLGIKAVHYSNSRLSRYEENVLNYEGLDNSTKSLISGLYRSARLACPYSDERRKTIWDVSVNVSGPLMLGYVKWCLDKARDLNLSRLYFLSRDGQILLTLAKILNSKLQYDIDLRYLYASRQALLLPTLDNIDDEELEWIVAPTSILSLRIIFRRLNIDIEEVSGILREYGYIEKWYDKKLHQKDYQKVKKMLLDKRIQNIVYLKIKEYRPGVLGYLKQEGLLDDERYGMVDIGWNGTLQRSISRVLDRHGVDFPVKGFYFGLRRRLKHKDSDMLLAYFSDYRNPSEIDSLAYIVPMTEVFVAADHGGVVSYRRNGDRYDPVLKHPENTTGVDWGVLIQQEAMEYLARMLCTVKGKLVTSLHKYSDIYSRNFIDFILSPCEEEARTFGACPLSEEQNEAYFMKLARKYNVMELFFNKFIDYTHHHNEWHFGSIAMSNKFLTSLLNKIKPHRLKSMKNYLGNDISVERGFGPWEGPYPHLNLPMVVWGYGPSSKFRVNSDKGGKVKLGMHAQNHFAGQSIKVSLNNRVIEEVPIVRNFANQKREFHAIEIDTELKAGNNEFVLEYAHWNKNDREKPVAVLFSRIECDKDK